MARPVAKTVRYKFRPASDARPRAMPRVWRISMREKCARALFLQTETRPAVSRFLEDGVGQGSDLFDFNRDAVACAQPARRRGGHANAMRSARENDRAGKKRGRTAEELDER